MTTIEAFLSYINNINIKLWEENGQLRYNAPKGTMTHDLRTQVAERKTEILTFLKQANLATQAPLPPIQPIARTNNNLPLSFAQERLWFLDQLVPDNPVYNVPAAVRLVGTLKQVALVQSLMEIVRRHETLRTTFVMQDGKPLQVIQPLSVIRYPLSVIDLQDLSVPEQNLEVQQLANSEAQRSFNLKCGPLFRTTLLQLHPQQYVLLVTIHHIATDGWSMGLFVKEFSALYEAFSTGLPSPLPKLPIQYADFAQWQRQWLSGELLETHRNYWKQQLTEVPPVLEIPSDYPRPLVNSFQGATEYFEISPELTQQLKSLIQQQAGVTLFMILLAAFALLLERYSGGQKDIVIGSPIANRKRKEIEPLIGFFANLLALRINLSGNPTFIGLLKQVQKITLEAYAHQDIPFELLVEALQPKRDMSRNPLVQVAFAFQNAPMPPLALKDLTLSLLEFESGTVRFDLEIHLWEAYGKLRGHCYYYQDLFKATTIKRLLGHFQTLLATIAENSKLPISEYSLLNEAERHQLLVEWNKTDSHYPRNKCIHHLFEAQVEQTPEAIAVLFEEQQLTYRELNTKANQLAHYLQTLGVKPEILVGICVERSLEMIIGLLGILKAGGAYVPFEPNYPKSRLAFMLSDTNVPILLTQEKLVEKLPLHQTQVICLDRDFCTFFQVYSDNNPISQVLAENLAYVIYTSGSTGKPKGVMIEHRNVLAMLYGFEKITSFTQLLKGTSVCPFSFDVSVWEFFSNLCFGGELHLISWEILTAPNHFANYLLTHHITSTYIPPALLSKVVSQFEKRATSIELSRMLVGVEPIKQSLLQRFRNLSKHIHIVNGYGPTETTICATFFSFESVKELNARTPIGSGASGYKVYIVNSYLQLVPVGIAGEIVISGVGLSRGYLNCPELTEEKFIPNPFSEELGMHVYKTGDLARHLPDGNIEYLGRIDNQVKIRGFRIELKEIEIMLSQHPQAREVVVTMQQNQENNKRLVAYVVPDSNAQTPMFENLNPELGTEKISQWEQVFDDNYSQLVAEQDLTFNIAGWHSSYTGLPIPAKEMQEWVEFTVNIVLSLHPNSILEIGCGTGLLLSRIAPHCSQYWGTDFSPIALQQVEQLKCRIGNLEHVTLLHRQADDFRDIELTNFDTIILNSVVQYFPSVTYLLEVLNKASQIVKTGGCIFVGDVRSLPLLKTYHASVQFHQAPASLTCVELQQRVQQHKVQEEELVIEPNFFLAFKQHNPRITQVQIQPKRGYYHNELTRFRYEVILWVGDVSTERTRVPEIKWQDWQSQKMTLSLLRQQLTTSQPELLGLRNIPNARLQTETKLLEWLANAEPTATVEQCQQLLSQSQPQGIDPQQVWQLTEELPYHVELSWASANPQGCYDVLFIHHSYKDHFVFPIPSEPLPKPWHDYANNPLQTKQNRKLVPQLRQFLQQKLPEYMVPSTFVMLEALPLTPNGKVDRKALVTPQTSQRTLEGKYLAPRNTVELQLTHIWETVLDLNPIGVQDNFFELGGHSLLAVRLMAKIEQQFGKNLPLATLFQTPTIEQLANLIRQPTDSQPWSPLVAIHRGGNRLPFFCIHPGGGNVLSYLELAHSLGTEQPFYALQSPGLNEQWELLASIEKMANYYIEALQTLQPQGPYQLGGWSFGGIVAFEMAQQLRQQGHEVALLALFDSYAPTFLNNMLEKMSEPKLIAFLARNVGLFFGKDWLVSVEELPSDFNERLKYLLEQAKNTNLLPPKMEIQHLKKWLQIVLKINFQTLIRYKFQRTFFARNRSNFAMNIDRFFAKGLPASVNELPKELNQQLQHILEQVKKTKSLPPEIEAQQLWQFLRILQLNTQAMMCYKPQRYFGRITLFRSSETVVENAPSNGWDNFAAGGLEIHQIPGNHYAMMKNPQVLVLAEQLSTYLSI